MLVLVFSLSGIALAEGPVAQPKIPLNLDPFSQKPEVWFDGFTIFEYNNHDFERLDADGKQLPKNYFQIERASLAIHAKLAPFTAKLRMYAYTDSARLGDSWINLGHKFGSHQLDLQVGYMYFGMGSFAYAPQHNPWPTWPQGTDTIEIYFDQGIQGLWSLWDGILVGNAGVFNGQRGSVDEKHENNDAKDVVGKLALKPLSLDKNGFGMEIGGTYRNGVNPDGVHNCFAGWTIAEIWQIKLQGELQHRLLGNVESQGYIGALFISPIPDLPKYFRLQYRFQNWLENMDTNIVDEYHDFGIETMPHPMFRLLLNYGIHRQLGNDIVEGMEPEQTFTARTVLYF